MTPALQHKLPKEWTVPQPEKGWHTQAALEPSWVACKEITKEHATSFFFASFPLPEEKKRAAFAVYALCRWFDDEIDETPEDQQPDQAKLMAEYDAIMGGSSTLPFAPAVAEVNRQYAIPREFWADLVEGVCMDRQTMIVANLAQLEIYCYHVASVVGLIMSKLFGLKDIAGVPHAVEMGLAMQLTNILRDVREDFEKGRIYLPTEEMAAYGTGPEAIAARRIGDPNWDKFMAMQIQRARGYYRGAEKGLPYLAGDGSRFTAKLMGRVYGGILGEIERHKYDVFTTRRYVPTHRKLLLALKALV